MKTKSKLLLTAIMIALAAAVAQADNTAIGGGVVTGAGTTNAFGTLSISGQPDIVAEAAPDVLTLVAGTGITFTSNAASDTVTIASAGGGGAVSITATAPIIVTPTPLIGTGVVSLDSTKVTNWDAAYTERRQWDGGATNLVAATGRISLGLVIGLDVERWDADLDSLASAIGTNTLYYRSSGDTWSAVTFTSPITFLNGVLGSTAGNGTVTNFSAGDLAPIFTTTETTTTTTPALSFVLSTAGAHRFLGNNTGSTAVPSYVQPAFTDLTGAATTAQGGVPILGTTGQVLTKNSATSYDVYWSDAGNPLPTRVRILTGSNGTYTPTAGTRAFYVECIGGGGAGGGATGAAGAVAIGAAAGGGAYCARYYSSVSASYSFSVGTGGVASSGGAGGNGIDTTFDILSAGGGLGGGGGAGGTALGTIAGASGGVANSGDLNMSGGAGANGIRLSASVGVSGGGGGAPRGGGASKGNSTTGPGSSGSVYGGGGGGALATITITIGGGSGAPGVIIVTEYF
jgi:hypothetical protein